MACMVYMPKRTPQPPTGYSEVDIERGRRFAQWLRSARALRGWNKARLSAASGVSQTYLGVLENDGINNATGGYQRPSEEIIEKIASATGADENAGREAAGYARLHAEPGTARRTRLALIRGLPVDVLVPEGITDAELRKMRALVRAGLDLDIEDVTAPDGTVDPPDEPEDEGDEFDVSLLGRTGANA